MDALLRAGAVKPLRSEFREAVVTARVPAAWAGKIPLGVISF